MTSACFLHFNGDVATIVRWVGGPHTAAQINPEETLAKLKDVVDPDVWDDLRRILVFGARALCNVEASEENFQAYDLAHGNHSSVSDNQDVFEQTIVKQSKRGLMLIMDPDLVHIALNEHLSPQVQWMYSTSAESLDHSRTAASDLGQERSPSTTGPIKSTNRHYILQICPINSVSGSGILPSPTRAMTDVREMMTYNAHSLD
jgi:hypothetical protein